MIFIPRVNVIEDWVQYLFDLGAKKCYTISQCFEFIKI